MKSTEKTGNARSRSFGTKTVVTLGMLAAVAYVAMFVSRVFPKVVGFLSFDLKDFVIVIAGFISGPLAAAVVAIVVSFIEMITVSTTGVIGLVMNILQSCAFACTAAAVYRKDHKMKGAVIGLVSGILVMTALMLLWNWLLTPLYMHVERSMVVGMLASVFLPFNLVKGGINATLAMLLYKPVVTALRQAKLVEPSRAGKGSVKWGMVAVSFVLLVSFVMMALVLTGKI